MRQILGQILPLAVAVTISPVPIIAEILLLFSDRPLPNAGAYVGGFTSGVAVVLLAFTAIAATQDGGAWAEGGSTVTALVSLVLGVLLLVGAVIRFRRRPAPGEDTPMPRWMDGIASFGTPRSLAVGVAVGALNPKNIAMALAASVTVAGSTLSTGEEAVTLGAYTLVAVLGVATPFVVALFMGERARPLLDRWREWLGRNNSTVMAVLFLVFGVVLVVQGIQGL
ncbi:MAG: GAP family protein [Acidimicrobiia bacterium]|nr:GAP family protein [Acidimicrobiia bacterium]